MGEERTVRGEGKALMATFGYELQNSVSCGKIKAVMFVLDALTHPKVEGLHSFAFRGNVFRKVELLR